jgi:hypothetical protein
VVGRQVEAYAERECVEVEFSWGQDHDKGADDYTADTEVADYAVVAGLLFEGEALFGWDGGLEGRLGHFGSDSGVLRGMRLVCDWYARVCMGTGLLLLEVICVWDFGDGQKFNDAKTATALG